MCGTAKDPELFSVIIFSYVKLRIAFALNHDFLSSRSVFLNRQAAARYRALASIVPGREIFSLEFVILIF